MILILLSLAFILSQSALALVSRKAPTFFPWTLSPGGALLLGVGLYGWIGSSGPLTNASYFYLALLGALYLVQGPYLQDYLGHHEPQRARLEAILIPLFCAAMVGVVLVPLGYSFLLLWEGMALLGYLLMVLEGPSALSGARWFFLASRLSGAGLFFTFIILLTNTTVPNALEGWVWLGLLVGFGTKAALFPLYLWLPKAHPVAISPLSALLSGGMTKLGLYGLYRSFDWVGSPPAWVGWALLLLGLTGAVYAVIRGLAERDYKAVLAYSSVENLNLLLAALGALWLTQNPLFVLAFFYHQLAHALFKALLFMGSGVLPVRSIDQLGGLWVRAPRTALLSLVGVMAAAGLPPLAGFLGEWYMILAFLQTRGLMALAAGAVALVGTLAAVLYLRSFGLAFLGAPRSPQAQETQESSRGMQLGMAGLAVLLILLSLLPGLVLRGFGKVPSYPVLALALLLVGLGVMLWAWVQSRPHRVYATWDTGYVHPGSSQATELATSAPAPNSYLSPRMQPTGLGYSEQVLRLFPFLRLLYSNQPDQADQAARANDTIENGHQAISQAYVFMVGVFRRLQSGSIHLYLLFQFLALLVVLGVTLL